MKFRLINESFELNETGLSRINQHISDKGTFAIIGSQDKDTKKDRFNELISEVSKVTDKAKKEDRKVGFNHLEGTYTYDNGEVGTEKSLIIYNITKEEAMRIMRKLNQESIIWKDDSFFGFLDANGNEDGTFNGNMSFNKDMVSQFGSKLRGKHNNAQGFVFEAFLVETNNRGNNFSKQNRAVINKLKLFSINN